MTNIFPSTPVTGVAGKRSIFVGRRSPSNSDRPCVALFRAAQQCEGIGGGADRNAKQMESWSKSLLAISPSLHPHSPSHLARR